MKPIVDTLGVLKLMLAQVEDLESEDNTDPGSIFIGEVVVSLDDVVGILCREIALHS